MTRPITIGELERQLPYDPTSFFLDEGGFNDLLETTLDREIERVEGWLRSPLEILDTEESVTIESPDIDLSSRPVQEIPRIEVDGHVLDGEDVIVDPNGFVIRPNAYDEIGAPTESASVRATVEYRYGFDTDDVPGAVEDALVRLVRSALTQIESDGIGNEGDGGTQVGYRPPVDVQLECRAAVQEYQPDRIGSAATVI